MQNRCNCGCGCDQGFVPVNSNWDFNIERSASRNLTSRTERQNRCNACEAADTARQRTTREDVCSGCGRARSACTCGQQTYAREDVCSGCGRARNACTCGQQTYAREDGCSGCSRARNACTCGQQTFTREDCADTRTAEVSSPACVMKKAVPSSGAKKGVGIVRVTKQTLGDIFDNASALKAGTLFPELHKPMNGYCPCGNECGDSCQQAAFAAWEVRLYLNTHPDDAQARALLNQLIGDCCEPNYATTFLTEECSRWAWTDDPWPWNIDANCCK